MGKYSEALKKSQTPKVDKPHSAPEAEPEQSTPTTREAVDALRMDRSPPQGPHVPEVTPAASRMDPRLQIFTEPNAIAGEAFKMLRAKILTRKADSRPRSIMITSPQPMDGKTMVSANLAISIARGINEYVVLVDCDLRRPSMHKLLGINAQTGIREYLEQGTSVADYMVKTPIDKLTLLPAGKPAPNPSELLSSEKMHQLVEELKARYQDRYVIFDATPAQFSAETSFLASMVDAVIVVVRAGKTAKPLLLDAVEIIGRDKILGLVFNASTETLKEYGYYYEYYSKPR